MVLLLRIFYYNVYKILSAERDATVAHLPFAGSPLPVLTITLAYVTFVLKLGPHLMRKRAPFDVKIVMQIYNILQILLNLYIGLNGLKYLHMPGIYTIGCISPLPAEHTLKAGEIMLCYLYYAVKISDYLDTIFFVLRKNFKQVTFLHVYHHVIMVLAGYITLRYYGTGGHHISIGVLNSFVHVFMYAYYFLSAINPAYKQSSWKRHITDMQLAQFVLLLVHALWPVFFRPDCTYPTMLSLFTALQMCVMIWLFGNFYMQAYLKRKAKPRAGEGRIKESAQVCADKQT